MKKQYDDRPSDDWKNSGAVLQYLMVFMSLLFLPLFIAIYMYPDFVLLHITKLIWGVVLFLVFYIFGMAIADKSCSLVGIMLAILGFIPLIIEPALSNAFMHGVRTGVFDWSGISLEMYLAVLPSVPLVVVCGLLGILAGISYYKTFKGEVYLFVAISELYPKEDLPTDTNPVTED